MYFTPDMISQAEARYGQPQTLRLNYSTPQAHFDFIRSTQKHGRAHDVTMYLYHEGRLAVTRKPMYPPGAFRPPSGGLHPGDTLEEGMAREGAEELGIAVIPEKYLLRVRVDFVCGDPRIRGDRIPWTTHVFRVKAPAGETPILSPQDHREIAEARWATEAEFFGTMRQGLLEMSSTGLLYRAHLGDVVWRDFEWS
jgi:8-oxo-dGTP pyrophosphatase MutT (NUDIX family)